MKTDSFLPHIAAALFLVTAGAGSSTASAALTPPVTLVASLTAMAPPTVEEARAIQASGRWDEAADAWHQIVEANPDHGTAWFNLGYCLHAGGHLEHALEAHKKASTFEDYHGIALYNLGCAYALLGRPDEAFEALNASQAAGFRMRGQAEGDSDLDSLRGDPRYRELLAREPAGLESKLEAMAQHMQRFVEQQLPQMKQRFAMFAQRAGEQLAQMLGKLAQDPRFAEIAQKIQQMMGGQNHGHHDAAAATGEPQARPDAGALLGQARQLQQSGRWLEAAAVYHRATEAAPDNPAAWFGLSYCLHMGGEYEKAIEAHKKAATFDQIRGVALYNLACAYSLTGRLDEAMEALEASRAAGFDLRETITTDSDLENLRADPRYAQLLADLGVEL